MALRLRYHGERATVDGYAPQFDCHFSYVWVSSVFLSVCFGNFSLFSYSFPYRSRRSVPDSLGETLGPETQFLVVASRRSNRILCFSPSTRSRNSLVFAPVLRILKIHLSGTPVPEALGQRTVFTVSSTRPPGVSSRSCSRSPSSMIVPRILAFNTSDGQAMAEIFKNRMFENVPVVICVPCSMSQGTNLTVDRLLFYGCSKILGSILDLHSLLRFDWWQEAEQHHVVHLPSLHQVCL